MSYEPQVGDIVKHAMYGESEFLVVIPHSTPHSTYNWSFLKVLYRDPTVQHMNRDKGESADFSTCMLTLVYRRTSIDLLTGGCRKDVERVDEYVVGEHYTHCNSSDEGDEPERIYMLDCEYLGTDELKENDYFRLGSGDIHAWGDDCQFKVHDYIGKRIGA